MLPEGARGGHESSLASSKPDDNTRPTRSDTEPGTRLVIAQFDPTPRRGADGRGGSGRAGEGSSVVTRVLVIDDEPQIVRARISLSVRGYEVSTAATGAARCAPPLSTGPTWSFSI